MKVFIGLIEVVGYFGRLNQGLNDSGIYSTMVNVTNDVRQYGYSDNSNQLVIFLKQIQSRRISNQNGVLKLFYFMIESCLRFILFIWACFNFDVFIFGSASTFFSGYDMPILKLLGKKIICVFTGSDIRPPYLNGYYYNELSTSEIIRMAAAYKEKMKWVEKWSDVIVSYEPQAQFQVKPFVSGSFLGFPFLQASDAQPATKNLAANDTIRILHCPTRPLEKGTPIIEKLIDKLKKQGFNIELIVIVGQSYATVQENIQQCHFVIDEVYSDLPMAGLSTEAAYWGKPTVVSGYYATCLEMGNLLYEEIPPTLFIHPEELESAVIKMIVDRQYREELGKQAREYVRTRYSLEQVAANYQKLIEGEIPKEWIADPLKAKYFHGWGMSEATIRDSIRKVVNKGGIKALQLQDKPELEKLVLDFAGIDL